jgi:hypothetical protein
MGGRKGGSRKRPSHRQGRLLPHMFRYCGWAASAEAQKSRLAECPQWVESGRWCGMIGSMRRTFKYAWLAAALVSGCAFRPEQVSRITPPAEALARQLRAEIWGDLQSNALIGNGNSLAADWANAGRDHDKLHIEKLLCGGTAVRLRCQFDLLRDGGVFTYLGKQVPDRLACQTRFRRAGPSEEWSIPRLPPRHGRGHSRTTIECQPVP